MTEAASSAPVAPQGPNLVDRALSVLDRLARWFIVAAIGIMVVVVGVQVLLRYATPYSFGWADEVSRLAFVVSIFLAIPLGIRSRAHIGVELLTARLPALAQSGLLRAMAVLSAGLMLVVAWQSTRVAIEQWDERMASLEFSAGWFLVPVAFGAAHSALHLLRIAACGPYRRAHQLTGLE